MLKFTNCCHTQYRAFTPKRLYRNKETNNNTMQDKKGIMYTLRKYNNKISEN